MAAVETFVNLEPNLQPTDLVSIEGEIPEVIKIDRIAVEKLPKTWHTTRDEALRAVGDGWVRAGDTVALLVPSAAVLGEWNMLLNPAHPDFAAIRFEPPKPFRFDSRMFR